MKHDFGYYVAGFALSLVCTAIPYYLVVNKTVTGNRLLAAIIAYAFVQMFIQVFFFLHLGRGPKPMYNVVFFFGTVGIVMVVIGGSLLIMSHLQHYMTPSEVTQNVAQTEGISQVEGNGTGACQQVYANHIVTINRGVVTPVKIQATRCDMITFNNEDAVARQIMFGTYPATVSYGGLQQVSPRKGHSTTITLNQLGTFQFYLVSDPDAAGQFTVIPR